MRILVLQNIAQWTGAIDEQIFLEIPPDMAVCEVVQLLKQNSSRSLKKRFAFIRRMYIENSIWSVGYFSSTIGINEELIRRYIEYQGKKEKPEQINLGFS